MRLKFAASLGLFAGVVFALAAASFAPYQPLGAISPGVAAQSSAPKQAPIFEVDP